MWWWWFRPILWSSLIRHVMAFAIGTLHVHEFGANLDGLIHYLDTARSQNITWIDTADVYGWYQDGRGRSNDLIGKAFERRPDLRDHFHIIAKCGIRLEGGYHIDLSPEWIESSVNRILSIFEKSTIDVLMIHNPTDTYDDGALAFTLQRLQKTQKIRQVGISNFNIVQYQRLQQALLRVQMKVDVFEIETSVLTPTFLFDDTISYMQSQNMTVYGWGPLGGDPYGGKNRLFFSSDPRVMTIRHALQQTGIEPDQAALAWLRQTAPLVIPILGTTSPDRLRHQVIEKTLSTAQFISIQMVVSRVYKES